MLRVNVAGGTNAGNKKPLEQPKPEWECVACSAINPGYATRCLTPRCNEKRS